MKITGSEWLAFCKAIPDHFYFDDSDFPDDFKPGDTVEVTCGHVDWQGPRIVEDYAEHVVPGVISAAQARGMVEKREVLDLLATFRRWRKLQTVEVVAVEVPKGRRGELEAFLATIKGRMVK